MTPALLVLPFPSADLSGHNTGHWSGKRKEIRDLRALAATEARKAGYAPPAKGDIAIHIRFVPPDRRGDRVNFPIRIKPLIDGIADGLGVNDARFLPSYAFAAPERPGRVEVAIGGQP